MYSGAAYVEPGIFHVIFTFPSTGQLQNVENKTRNGRLCISTLVSINANAGATDDQATFPWVKLTTPSINVYTWMGASMPC